MGFNQYSSPLAPADMYQSLPLEQILQGAKTVYDRGEQNFEKIQGLVNAAYSIPSLPGKDTEVKNKKMQQYMSNVQELAKGNLSDPRIANQIQGYISSVAQDPDILSIAERATSYANMLKEEKEARLKGQKYFNKGLFDARRYMEGNTYQRDTRFSNQGGIAPDEAEILKKVKDIAQVTVSQKREKGIITTVEEVLEKEGRDLYNKIASSDPNYRNYYRTMWDEQNYDKTPEQIKSEYFNPLEGQIVTSINKVQSLLSYAKTDAEKAKYTQLLQDGFDKLSNVQSLKNNPNTLNEVKDLAFEEYLQSSSNAAVQAITGVRKINTETDQLYLKNVEHQQKIVEEQLKPLALAASQMGKSLQEIAKSPNILKEAAKLAQALKIEEYSQKENIKMETKLKLKTEKLAQLGSDKISPSQPILIGNTNYTKSQWDDILNKAKSDSPKWNANDKTALIDVIKTYPEYFGLPDDYSSLAGTDVKINKEGTIEIINPWYRRNTPAADLSRFATAVNDAALRKQTENNAPPEGAESEGRETENPNSNKLDQAAK